MASAKQNNATNSFVNVKANKGSVASFAPITSTTNQTYVTTNNAAPLAGGGGSQGFGFADTPTGSAATVPNPILGSGLFSTQSLLIIIVIGVVWYLWKGRK
jgi:hypothetical protein